MDFAGVHIICGGLLAVTAQAQLCEPDMCYISEDEPFIVLRELRLPTSVQSSASHSGGQLWLLQGSVSAGREAVQAMSSRTFSSDAESLLLHSTSRVRRPLLQLRLQSDHAPVHQLHARKSKTVSSCPPHLHL